MRTTLVIFVTLILGWISVAFGADFNGDGTNDIGIFRPSAGLWAIRGITRIYFGGSEDETVPGDYNGDGASEIAIYRPDNGLWAIRGLTRAYYGTSVDEPIYTGGGTAPLRKFEAGDNTIGISDRGGTTLGSYTKVAEFMIGQPGTLRIVFSLSSDGLSGHYTYGQIYRNGSALGTERHTYSSSPEEFSEDISGWSTGDLCQLYMYSGGQADDFACYTNFKINVGPGPFCTYMPPVSLL
jgi:hypothetical protein